MASSVGRSVALLSAVCWRTIERGALRPVNVITPSKLVQTPLTDCVYLKLLTINEGGPAGTDETIAE